MWYERYMVCKCGMRQRKTAKSIPLDGLGQLLNERQEKGFIEWHKTKHNCLEPEISYTDWEFKNFTQKMYSKQVK